MLQPSDTYEQSGDDWISRLIVDEVVIVPLCRSDAEIQYIYSISNPTGLRIWQLLDGKHSVRHIQETLKSEYLGNEDEVEREVLEFLTDLLSVQLIKKVKRKTNSSKPKPPAEKNRKRTAKQYEKPEINKIKMEPEQAVLSCCTSAAGSVKIGLFSRNWCTFTCVITNCVIDTGNNHHGYEGAS